MDVQTPRGGHGANGPAWRRTVGVVAQEYSPAATRNVSAGSPAGGRRVLITAIVSTPGRRRSFRKSLEWVMSRRCASSSRWPFEQPFGDKKVLENAGQRRNRAVGMTQASPRQAAGNRLAHYRRAVGGRRAV
jgi:hypothetical protein